MAAAARQAPGAAAWSLLVVLGLLWGSSFMFTNIAVREIPPVTLSGLRLALAALVVWLYARARGVATPGFDVEGGRIWKVAAVSALIGSAGPFVLISWSQQHIPSALSGLLMAPMPLLSLLLSHFLVAGEGLTAGRLAGFALGFGGVAALIGAEAFTLLGGGDAFYLMGQLASLTAMTGYALNGIYLKRSAPPEPLGVSVLILAFAALMTLPAGLIIEQPDFAAVSAKAWGLTVILGLGASGAAQVILMLILALAGPPFLASVNYQVPLWSAVFGVTLLGETLPPAFWAALALILAGLAIAQFAGRR